MPHWNRKQSDVSGVADLSWFIFPLSMYAIEIKMQGIIILFDCNIKLDAL